ncbi:hypothetical protein KKC44_05085 [Patescibacteria group bacterium]|nr:hypothetical protein [Patescibacteria group bacterium]MBU2259949.1 hypothetical protein [Patescibacteria group bacterium]
MFQHHIDTIVVILKKAVRLMAKREEEHCLLEEKGLQEEILNHILSGQ